MFNNSFFPRSVYISKNAVDGDNTTQFLSNTLEENTVKAWLVIDLGEIFMIHQIRLVALNSSPTILKRKSNMKVSKGYFKFVKLIAPLQIYVSNHFMNSGAIFEKDYERILKITGTPQSQNVTYNLNRIHSGRYVIFERQLKNNRLQMSEVEILTYP